MIENLSLSYIDFFNLAKAELPFMGYLLAGVWAFNILNWLLRSPLNSLGIRPRNAFGLIGIIFAPVLHGNFNHLFFNTIPFFVLGMFLLALGQNTFIVVSVCIALGQGFLIWLFGRKAIHIGASGVISGYFGFILTLAYFQPTLISLVLAVITLYYFGSILFGIFPTEGLVSWESHLAGLVVGIGLAYLLYTNPQYQTLLTSLL